jgi:hypothetical protein
MLTVHIDDDESTDASDGGSGEVHGDMRKKECCHLL